MLSIVINLSRTSRWQQRRGNYHPQFFTLGLILVIAVPIFAHAALVDDRYHYSDYETNPNVSEYSEWWFFNLYKQDVQAVIQYSWWDPAQITPLNFGLMYVSIHRSNIALDVLFPIPWENIVTSPSSAALIMGPETITVNDDGSYTLSSSVLDEQGNTVAWDLVHVQQLPSLNPSLITISPTEEMNWYAQMPSAVVSGAIIVNGETIVVDSARGYHDHNWGPWKLTDTLWNWFETNTPDCTIVGYDLFALNTGQITVEFADQTVQFEKSQYSIFNYGRTTLYGLPFKFPTKTTVVANNGEYILTLNIETGTTSYVAKPEMDLIWIVLESDATFKGQLISRGVVEQIASVCFRKYTINIPNQ